MITFAVHQVRAGLAGASEDFEQMLGLLVRATCGEANLVFANPGDWGIDVLVGDLGGRVTVWQAKYFARGVSRSQRNQINASFASALKAAADHGYALERWVLCIPASMDGPALQWWQAWKAGQQQGSGVAIELWDETRLRELLLRPAAGDVRRHYYNSYRHDGDDAPATVSFPYRGLSAFAEQDAGLFFGREAATARVLEMMSACRDGAGLLVVSGVSGAGKSSLMQAGVLPRLRDVGLASVPEAVSWPRLVFTPGRDPLGELSVRIAPLVGADAAAVRQQVAADPASFALTVRQAALTAPAEQAGQAARARQRRVLLVIDQCEQMFTLCQAQERQAFITALHAAATADNAGQGPAAMVVLVIRADFEAALADFSQLSAAVQDRYLLTAMTMRQLRLAITRPATAAGSRADDDLVQVLLEEVRARASGPGPGSAVAGAGVLPLLSHALDQAWRTRAGQVLTLADYERTGGIEGAVALSAQRAYEGLTPAQRDVARQLFTRLTATASDGTDTAARATRADLTAGKDAAQARDVAMVVETFAAQRLLTLGAETVEISHEALLTAWPLLREWLSGTHADRIIRTRLHATTQEWVRSGRDPSYLYDGSRLEAAVEAAARIGADVRHAPLSPAENEFLHASRHASRRRSRRRQGFTAVLLALVSALAATTVVAFRAGQEAAGQRDAALSGLLSSKSLASSEGNATASATESIIAWALDPSSAQAHYAMLAAAARPQIATLTAGTPGANSVAFSADGRTLAMGTWQGTAELWDLATLRQVGKPLVAGAGNTLESVTFSPDGKMLATGGADGSVRLWDVATGRQMGKRLTATNHEDAESVVFSPDGKMLAIASANTVQLWNVGTGQRIGRPFGAKVGPVAFSPNGKLLATGGDNEVQLWNVSTRRQISAALTSTANGVFALAFSPDGTTLAAGFASSQGGLDNGAVQLWNVAANRRIGDPLADNAGAVTCMAFSPDGTTLVTGSNSGAVQLWNTAARELIGYPLAGGAGAVSSLAVSPDGATLASATADGTARLWKVSLATGSQIGSPLVAGTAPARTVLSIQVAFSPDGKTLATGSSGGLTASGNSGTLWNVAAHRETGRIIDPGIDAITTITFSPDGGDLAAGYGDGTVRLWNTVTRQQTGPPLADATSSTGAVEAEAFSPDGTTLATVGSDGSNAGDSRVRLWNVAAHKETGSFALAGLGTPAFAPGGSTMAFAGTTLQLWNVATHHSTSLSYSDSAGVISSLAFSPDGKTLAVGGKNDTVQLPDVTSSKQKYSPLIGGTVDIIQSMAFSPDGTILAVGSGNGSVQLWDLATSQRVGTPLIPIGAHLIAGFGEISSTAFSPDGKILAVGYGDGTVRLWDVGYLVDTLRRLCTQIGGSLTRTEWTQYVPQGPAYRNVCP